MNKDIEEFVLAGLAAADNAKMKDKQARTPVHVMYGGAHMFTRDTPAKMGELAIRSLEAFSSNFADFARAVWLKGAEELPKDSDSIQELEFALADDPEKAKTKTPEAWFAWSVFQKTLEKLKSEPVEDYRIDFEDGYGIRTDEEEDTHCISASNELAKLVFENGDHPLQIPLTGFRIKSFQPETRHRAIRTFELFLSNLLQKSNGRIPPQFVVTLPKIKGPAETGALAVLLTEIEKRHCIDAGTIGIEILIETPESLSVLREIAKGCNGRCVSAHFGAYDYTAAYGISAVHQHLKHEACVFARNIMQVALSPLGIRLSDSVTIEMPMPVHRGENLSIVEIAENQSAVREAWRKHFNNVTYSRMYGFFQSWDLHPAQLPARYAAVYSYFLESFESQAKRLSGFLQKATQAMTTGNIFDDMASAEGLLNFFTQGIESDAFTLAEVTDATGLTLEEFESGSFAAIMAARFSRKLY